MTGELTARKLIFRHRWRYIFGVFWLLAVDSLQLVFPTLLGRLADRFQSGNIDMGGVGLFIGVIVGVTAVMAVCRYLWRLYIVGTARRIEYEIRGRFFEHLLGLSADFYDRRSVGDLMAHATNDIQAVRMAFGFGIVMLTDALFLIFITVGAMILTGDLRLTVLVILPLPVVAIVSSGFGRLIFRRFRRVQEAFSRLSELVRENVSGIRVVKAFAREEGEMARFGEASRENFEANMSLAKVFGFFSPLVQVVAGMSFVLLILVGSRMVLEGRITLGDFVATGGYLAMLVWPAMAVGYVINVIQRGSASMARLNEIMAEEPRIREIAAPYRPEKVEGRIEFRKVTFTYPGAASPAIRDVNFVIEPGERVAVVGRTGSGKSTLVKLLLRVYDPDSGEILVDGVEVKRWSLAALREAIGYVPQDSFLFSRTIADNIAFGAAGTTEGEIRSAAAMAALARDVEGFDKGYGTMVGERGVTLSGGQRQRVSIARAFLRRPAILVVDDALSAVDASTEEELLANLGSASRGKTSIFIAHRVSTIKGADRILVMQDGRLVEAGKHGELLEKGGEYARFYRRQLLEDRLKGR